MHTHTKHTHKAHTHTQAHTKHTQSTHKVQAHTHSLTHSLTHKVQTHRERSALQEHGLACEVVLISMADARLMKTVRNLVKVDEEKRNLMKPDRKREN